MGAKRVVNIGDVFGQLTVIKESCPQHYVKNTGQPYTKRVFSVRCACGKSEDFDTQLNHLVTGKTVGCGCVNMSKVTRHGMCGTPTNNTYKSMLSRCTNPGFAEYERYGGDGVVVCDRWLEGFENFFEDMGERPQGHTLNRLHSSKIYSKETCEWATLTMQSYDQRMKSSNTSGRTGVCLYKGLWIAYIGYENKSISLGSFLEKEDAIAAREKAEMELYGFTKN